MKDNILLKVKCTSNENYRFYLTINKVYEVLEETEFSYYMIDDSNDKDHFPKERFEIVKEEKQVKEYTLQEVLKMPKGTILKLFPYDESEREIIVEEGIAENKYLYYIDSDGCHEEGVIISSWIMDKPRFKIVETSQPKQVNFIDVINSSSRCRVDYYRIDELIEEEQSYAWLKSYQDLDQIMSAIGEEFNTIAFKEILVKGKWYLQE